MVITMWIQQRPIGHKFLVAWVVVLPKKAKACSLSPSFIHLRHTGSFMALPKLVIEH